MAAEVGLLSLPSEILLKIMEYLGAGVWVLRLAATCSRLAALVKHQSIWQPLVRREFPSVVRNVRDDQFPAGRWKAVLWIRADFVRIRILVPMFIRIRGRTGSK